jgi:hypothetical protein
VCDRQDVVDVWSRIFLGMNIHLDEINLLLLWHNLIHIRLEAGVGLDGLCANGALGR